MAQLAGAAALAWRAGRGPLAAQIALTVVTGILPVGVAWMTKLVLDALTRPGPVGGVVPLAIGLAGIGLLSAVAPSVAQFVQNQLNRSVILHATGALYAALDRFVGLARFEDPWFRDRLQLAEQSGRAAPYQLLQSGLSVARSAITLSGFLATLLATGPWMAAAVAAAAVPTLRAELMISRSRAEMVRGTGHAMRREMFYSQLQTDPHAAKEVRLFGLGEFLRDRMLGELGQVQLAHRRMDRREFVVQGILGLVSALFAGAGLVWAIGAAARGALTIGDVSVFVAAVAGTQSALFSIVRDAAEGHHSLLMFDHFLAVVRSDPDLPVLRDATPVCTLRDGIEFRDVWFRYSDEHPWILRGVNLTIPAARGTALVGRNGAGKSTLVKLLCRFYDPTHGRVLWDGVDLRELPVDELRARIGAVFQDFMAYDFTARENIGVGDLAALDDTVRISTAARRAQIADAVAELPKGYETLLTRSFLDQADRADPETGVFLSGGQWQRIALARAFLRERPDLLILDEPSAGLDAEAEYDVHTRLRRRRAGRTSVLVSHRLSAVRDADVVVVLDDGEVVELGTHRELMAVGGKYAHLFGLQARGYRPDEVDPAGVSP